MSSGGTGQNNVTSTTAVASKTTMEHPLAMDDVPESPPIIVPNTLRLSKATVDTVAACLSDLDVGRIQLVIRSVCLHFEYLYNERTSVTVLI